MTRNYIALRIKRHGTIFILKQPTNSQPFPAYLKNGNQLWVTAIQLSVGSLIAPLSRPTSEYIVATMTDQKFYEEYQLLKVNCRGSLFRFDTTARDTFGRSINESADLVYLDLPLCLYQSAAPKDQINPAISSTCTVYRFTTATGYEVRTKDQLHIGDTNLTITALLIQPDGLLTFEAVNA